MLACHVDDHAFSCPHFSFHADFELGHSRKCKGAPCCRGVVSFFPSMPVIFIHLKAGETEKDRESREKRMRLMH